MKRLDNFDAFYRYYLDAHANAWNRRMHLLGWTLGGVLAVPGLLSGRWWLVPLGGGVALGVALLGHRYFERNASIIFKYPVWTTLADLRMFLDMARGRLAR